MNQGRDSDRTDRRAFLQAGALASAVAIGRNATTSARDTPGVQAPEVVPRRASVRTGVESTMFDKGAIRGPSLDSILRHSYSQGVRVFDTAKAYGSEPNFRKWFA